MAFPDLNTSSETTAVSALENALVAAGATPNAALGQFGIVTQAVANLYTDGPPTLTSFGIGAPGAALSDRKIIYTKTGLTDNTAADIVTVTVPNGKVATCIRTTFIGSLGAGGAIGAGEASHVISYDFIICRTAGVAAVALIATATGSAKQAVAGADTVTTLGAVSAVSGAVGAVNTFTLTIKVTKGAGASANHTGMVLVETINEFASGVTVAQA